MERSLARFIGSAVGIGYLPVAPGTFASAAAAILYFFMPILREPLWLILCIVITVVLGVWAGWMMEDDYGEDPSQTVIDEVAGQWLALLAIPASPPAVLLAFLFFRIYDIAKPGPVDRAQRLPGGWGIMADDVLAGLFANLSLRVVLLILPLLPFGWSL
jgi:phosphatidylglycerophosphatase A